MLFETSVFLQVLLFYHVYDGHHITEEGNSDVLASFTKLTMIAILVAHVLFGPFVMKRPVAENRSQNPLDCNRDEGLDKTDEDNDSVSHGGYYSERISNLRTLNKTMTWKFIVCSEFQLFLWSFVIPLAVSHFLYFNTGFIAKALEETDRTDTFLMVFKLGVVIVRLTTGLILDQIRFSVRIYVLVILVHIIAFSGQIMFFVAMFTPGWYRGPFLTVGFLLSAIVEGAVFILIPVMISDIFGMDNFSRNLALVLSCKTLLVLIMQLIFGYSFDAACALHPLSNSSHNVAGYAYHNISLTRNATVPIASRSFPRDLDGTRLDCIGAVCIESIFYLNIALVLAAFGMFTIVCILLHSGRRVNNTYCKQTSVSVANSKTGLKKHSGVVKR